MEKNKQIWKSTNFFVNKYGKLVTLNFKFFGVEIEKALFNDYKNN